MEFHGSVQSRKARRGFCIVYLYDCFFFTYLASHQYQKIPRSLLHAHLNGLFPTVDTCYNVAKSFHWYSCRQDLQNNMRVIASKDSNDDFITFLSSVPSSPGLVKTTCRQCRQSQEVVVHKIKIHTAKDTVIGDKNKQKLRTLTKDCESAHSSHQLDHCSHWQKLTYLQT